MLLFKRNKDTEETEQKKGFLSSFFGKSKVRGLSMMLCMALMLCVGAFADDGTGGATASGFSSVWGSFDDLGTLMTKVWAMMTANPLLCIMLAVLLLSVGCRVVRMLMRTARGH